VNSQSIITRIYLPRLVLPITATLPGLVDFVMSFVVLVALMLFYGVPFTVRLLVVPALLLMAIATAIGAGLWLAASNALYRDIREGTPFLIQILMFVSVIFPAREASAELRWVLGLNPMATVIEGSRWSVIGGSFPTDLLGPGLIVMTALVVSGLVYFKRIEDTIVDVV
jgi:lipopolysaccharide transport system permease protein